MVHSYRPRRLNWIGGAFALGAPIGPEGLVTGAQLRPKELQAFVICLPKSGLAGLLLNRFGEFVCLLWFQDAAPCSVSWLVTRPTSDVSTPLTRKFWPLVL